MMKQEFDSKGRVIYTQSRLDGVWVESEYDKNDNKIYFATNFVATPTGSEFIDNVKLNIIDMEQDLIFWWKKRYTPENYLVEYEDSKGNWWDIKFFPETNCPFCSE